MEVTSMRSESEDPVLRGKAGGTAEARHRTERLRQVLAFQCELCEEPVAIHLTREQIALLDRHLAFIVQQWYVPAHATEGARRWSPAGDELLVRELGMLRELLRRAAHLAEFGDERTVLYVARVVLEDLIQWLGPLQITALLLADAATRAEVDQLETLQAELEPTLLFGGSAIPDDRFTPIVDELMQRGPDRRDIVGRTLEEISQAQALTAEAARQRAREAVLRQYDDG
jgi:hypothetical protein